MRILHATTFLQGGAGRIITGLAIAQHRDGADVRIVADSGESPGYCSYPEYTDALRAAGVRSFTVTSVFTRGAELQQRARAELIDALTGWRPDVIHAHAAVPAWTAKAALPDVALVQTMHGWGVRKTAEQSRHDIAVMERADMLITPSHAAAATLRAAGLERSPQVIPYGIADAGTSAVDAEDSRTLGPLREAGKRIALCVGTIGERKNQRLLVDALPEDTHAVFIGDGDAGSLTAYAAGRGAGRRVHVLGYRRQASRYLAWADALVLPSRNEGLPLVILEACRAGVPVVASDAPELRESLDDGRVGTLFAPDDAAALHDALQSVLEASCLDRFARAAAARAWFAENYRERVMIERYAKSYYAAVRAAAARRACSDALSQIA
jgi:glycosyltransferase involved in cell wall biosynthesis